MTAQLTVRNLIARAVALETESPVFGLLGSANMHLMADLQRQGMEMVNVRHENMAIAMADGYFRATGALALATVTQGPGLTQIATNLMVAARRGSSMVVLAGDSLAPVGTKSLNAMDSRAFVEASGGTFVAVRTPDTVLDDVRRAFLLARTLPGPVVLGIPTQHQSAMVADQQYSPSSTLVAAGSADTVDPIATERLGELLATAERPVIIAGRGAMDDAARDALIELGAASGALLGTTLPAKGLFAGVPFDIGVVGGYGSFVGTALLERSDLVVGFGVSFSHHMTQGDSIFRQARVVSVTTAGAGLVSDSRASDLVVRADATSTARLLTPLVEGRESRTGYRTDRVAELLAPDLRRQEIEMAPAVPVPETVDPRLVAIEVEASLPDRCRWVISPSQTGYFPARFLIGGAGHQFITTTEFAAIGHGMSTGIGASFAAGDTLTVVFEGDGAAMMNIQELHTAALYGARVLVVIINDEGFGTEFHRLTDDPEGYALAQTPTPDLVALAESMGVPAVKVTDLTQIGPALQRFVSGSGPMVLDVRSNRGVVRPVPMGKVSLDL